MAEEFLLDSKTLLRISKSEDPKHLIDVNALKVLVGQLVRFASKSRDGGCVRPEAI